MIRYIGYLCIDGCYRLHEKCMCCNLFAHFISRLNNYKDQPPNSLMRINYQNPFKQKGINTCDNDYTKATHSVP